MNSVLSRLSGLWNRSVRHQLVIGVAVVHALLMTVFVIDMVSRQQDFLRNEALAKADALARTLAVASASAVLSRDIGGLEEIIGATRNMPGLTYASVIDPAGRVLAHTRPELEGKYVSDPLSLSLLERTPRLQYLVITKDQIDLAMPIVTGSRMLGWARIGLAQSAQQKNLNRVVEDGMSYAVIAILMGGLFALYIGARLSSGLDKLVTAVDAVRAGDRGFKAEEGADEIGRLGSGFNAMLDAVRAGEEKFRTVADFTYDWEYWRGPDGKLIWMSPSCELFTGYTPEAFIQDPGLLANIVHPEDRHLYEAHMNEVEAGSIEPGELDFRVRHSSGQIIWVDHHCVDITRADGTLLGRRASNRDITLRKQAEDSLRRWAQLFKDASWGIAICSPSTQRLQAMNPVFARMHGYTEEELTDQPGSCVYPNEARATVQANLLLSEPTGHHTFEAEHQRKDGSRFPAQMDVTTVKDAQGAVLYHVVNVQDITERRRAQDEIIHARDAAEAASKAKGDFLAVMNHELRTPLNGIKGMLQVLRQNNLSAQERADYLEHALAASDNLALILNDLLDVTRLEAGKMPLFEEPFHMNDVAGPVCAGVEPAAKAKGMGIALAIAPDLADPLLGDPGRIRQILLSLLGNAVKFSNGGQVDLEIYPVNGPRALRADDRLPVHFTVRDTGIGIAHEHLLNIFEPFTQVESPYTRMHGGIGLGLALVKRLTALMGGRLEAYSEPGHGTEVHLTLPLRRVETCTEPTLFRDKVFMEQAERDLVAHPVKPRVLVVEDDPLNQITTMKYLEMLGCEGKVAANGTEALQALADEYYDAVLMDIQMPGMDGVETMQRIRESDGRDYDPAIPIVALTAHAMASDRERFLDAGMDGYVAKPCSPETLWAELQRVLSRSEARLAAPSEE